MKKIYLLHFIILVIAVQSLYSQTEDIQIGSGLTLRQQTQGALFDYSDPEAINMKINIWGFVRYPGRYIVPNYSTIQDILSLAGGPTQDAHLEDLRIFRIDKDSVQQFLKFDYNDLMWEKELSKNIRAPKVEAGDIVIIPGSPRFYFRDYLQISLSILSAAISLAILFINIF
jgi:polysaccharide biosynthesis/export protein